MTSQESTTSYVIKLLEIKTLDELAQYFGAVSYARFKSLIYPNPQYVTFSLAKKSGGVRTISVPKAILKNYQKKLALDLLEIYGVPLAAVNSFVKQRNVKTNALPHCGRALVMRLDLKNFFPSISFGRVQGLFRSGPFNFPDEIATVLAQVCTYQNQLPQGAPSSPVISNFICRVLDERISALAKRFKARYTRYADDLTFSFSKRQHAYRAAPLLDIGTGQAEPGRKLIEIIERSWFTLNSKKTSIASNKSRQMVTGIIVNKFPNLPSQYTSALRNALYIWEKHGYLVASETTVQHLHKRIYASGEAPKIENIIRGKLLYLRMIKGTSDPAYQRMAIAYNKLLAQKKHIDLSITSMKIDPIVATHQDAIRATWLIESMESTGTAFAIGNNLLLTCAHCVGDLK